MPLDPKATFDRLMAAYGPQGWWPIVRRSGEPGYDNEGYHPGLDSFPEDPMDRFEIMTGAILTQNTAWSNVRIALRNLRSAGIRMPLDMLALDEQALGHIIRPSGYYNQKAKRLIIFARACVQNGWITHPRTGDSNNKYTDGSPGENRAISGLPGIPPGRNDLLALSGIGPETADSMLLYAYGHPVPVVDAYARRIFSRMYAGTRDGPPAAGTYDEFAAWFRVNCPQDDRQQAEYFAEYHALLVKHAKQHCTTVPQCSGCPLRDHCVEGIRTNSGQSSERAAPQTTRHKRRSGFGTAAIAVAIVSLMTAHHPLPAQELRARPELNAAKTFGPAYTQALALLRRESATIIGGLRRAGGDPELLLPAVFPEFVRYSAIRDVLEQSANMLAYVNRGAELGNFSVGYCQMKPRFAEQVEAALTVLEVAGKLPAQLAPLLAYAAQEEPARRQERLNRLRNLDWQMLYLAGFGAIVEIRFASHLQTADLRHKQLVYAAAYNAGFGRDYQDLLRIAAMRFFPDGRPSPGTAAYAYVDVSLWFAQHYLAKFIAP